MFNQVFKLTEWSAEFETKESYDYEAFYKNTVFEKERTAKCLQPEVEALEARRVKLYEVLKGLCKENLGAEYKEDENGNPTDWKVEYSDKGAFSFQAAMRVVLNNLLVKVTALLRSDQITAMRAARTLFEQEYQPIMTEIVILEMYTHPLQDRPNSLYSWLNSSIFESSSQMVEALDKSLNYTGYSILEPDKDVQARLAEEALNEPFGAALVPKWKQFLSFCNNHKLLCTDLKVEYRIPKALSSCFLQLLSKIGAGLPESQTLSVSTAIYSIAGQEELERAARSTGIKSIYQSMDKVVEDFFKNCSYSPSLGGYIRKTGLPMGSVIIKHRPLARVTAYVPRSDCTFFGVNIPPMLKMDLESLETECPYSVPDVLTGRVPTGLYNMTSVLMRFSKAPVTVSAQGPLGVIRDFLIQQLDSGVSKAYLLTRPDLGALFSCDQKQLEFLIQSL